jgi:uncharacterized coiled-coil protein SlyX
MTTDKTDSGTRFDDFEARLAYQDQALHELGNEVYQQQQQIVRLESAIKKLVSRLESIEQDQPGPSPVDEIPPHY